MNYHGKRFKVVSNSDNGEVSGGLIFHYQQEENILTCKYQSEKIISGHLIGLVNEDGSINMRYHQVNHNKELMTGQCHSTPERMTDGRIRLHESWQWTSGDCSKGQSILEELIV